MFRSRYVHAAVLLTTAAMLLGGRPLVYGRAAPRSPPSIPGLRRYNEQHHPGGGVTERGSGHRRTSSFSVFSVAGDVTDEAPSRPPRSPFASLLVNNAGAPRPLTSILSMLSIVAADLRLRELFRRLEWSFPSSVAGMACLFAGLIGLDRHAPSCAERVVRVLEPGSAQFSAWLPVVVVPALVPWICFPLASLAASSASLSDAAVAAAKLATKAAAARASGDYSYFYSMAPAAPATAGTGTAKLRVAANATKLLLTVAGFWLAHLGSTAAVVTAISPASSLSSSPAPSSSATAVAAASSSKQKASAPVTGFFGPRLVRWTGVGTVAWGAASCVSNTMLRNNSPVWPWYSRLSILASAWFLDSSSLFPLDMAPLLQTMLWSIPAVMGASISMGLATLFGFAGGHVGLSSGGALSSSLAPHSPWKAALIPLATSVATTAATAGTLGWQSGMGVTSMRDLYVAGDDGIVTAGGDVLFSLLGPAVLSFSAPLFRMRGVIFGNARQVVGGSIFCASSALFGVALTARLLGLPKAFRAASQAKPQSEATSLVSKLGQALQVCFRGRFHKALPPKATSVASALGTYASPAIAGVLVLTGVLGATFGAKVLDSLGVKDPMVRGLIQGGTSNMFGVAAASEQHLKRNGPAAATTTTVATSARDVSTVGMILTCAAGTVLVNIPPVRSALLSIALGSTTSGSAMPLSVAETKKWRRDADFRS